MSIPRIPRKVPSGPEVDRFLDPDRSREPAEKSPPASEARARTARKETAAKETAAKQVSEEAKAPTGPSRVETEPSEAPPPTTSPSPTKSGPKKARKPRARKATASDRATSGTRAAAAKGAAEESDWRELLGGPSIATSIRVPMELQEKLRDAAYYLDGWDMTRILVEGAARLVVELDQAVGGIPERPELRKVELD